MAPNKTQSPGLTADVVIKIFVQNKKKKGGLAAYSRQRVGSAVARKKKDWAPEAKLPRAGSDQAVEGRAEGELGSSLPAGPFPLPHGGVLEAPEDSWPL